MSEQAPNSQHDTAVSNIENMFLRREGAETSAPAPDKQRRDNGQFARQGEKEPAQAEAQGTEQVPETEGQEPAQGAAPQSEETIDIDFDIEGQKETYALPKKIADRFIQHADYTRKTQDLAELRRGLSAQREAANLEKAFEQSIAQERNQLVIMDAQIAQYQNINWGAIEDTGQLVRLREQLNQLRDQRASLDTQVKAKRGDFDERVKGVTQEAMAAGVKYVEQNIKGYNEKTQAELFEYGRSQGYLKDELARIIDPRIIVTLWKASQFDALQAAKPGVMNKAQQAAPVVRPGATQRTVSRVQAAAAAIQKAPAGKAKALATEDYFAARFGER